MTPNPTPSPQPSLPQLICGGCHIPIREGKGPGVIKGICQSCFDERVVGISE